MILCCGGGHKSKTWILFKKYILEDFHWNKCLLSHYWSPNDATQWWLSLWPTDGQPATFAVLWPGCQRWNSENSEAVHSSAFNTTDSLFSSPVCEAAFCFFWSLLVLWVNCCYGRTNKVKIDDYRWWNLKLKLKWGPETHLLLLIITKCAIKDNKMKIFKIITLT